MTKEASSRTGKGNASEKGSKRNAQTLTGNDKSAKQVSLTTGTVKGDSAGRFVESANEHMLRAWESIHKRGVN